ncbi:MAG: hypothetical protein QN168_07115 [Armatimonadota bacterium]|nr:hypothetical protein [Armatimonadota bacterium]
MTPDVHALMRATDHLLPVAHHVRRTWQDSEHLAEAMGLLLDAMDVAAEALRSVRPQTTRLC